MDHCPLRRHPPRMLRAQIVGRTVRQIWRVKGERSDGPPRDRERPGFADLGRNRPSCDEHELIMWTRRVLAAVGAGFLLIGAPWRAGADTLRYEPVVWAADSFTGVDRALIGCVRPVDWGQVTPTREWCFVAHNVTEGPDIGKIRVVTRYDEWELQLVPRTHAPQIFEQVLPADALVWSGRQLRFRGTLDSIGDVDLASIADEGWSSGFGYGSCTPEQAVDADLRSSQPLTRTIARPVAFSGAVAGSPVNPSFGSCFYLVKGQTDGLWVMNTFVY